MIPETVREVFVFLQNVGLVDVILPFMIAFALLYGVFEKVMIFGTEGGKPKSMVNMVVAGLISLIFVVSLNLVMMMTQIIWIFTVIIVAVLFMLMLMGLFGADLHNKDGMTAIKIFLSLIIGIIGAIIAKYIHPDWTQTQLFIFGLVVFAVTAILASLIKKTDEGEGGGNG